MRSYRRRYRQTTTGWHPNWGFPFPWYCDGCNHEHGSKTTRYGIEDRVYCGRQFFKELDRIARAKARE